MKPVRDIIKSRNVFDCAKVGIIPEVLLEEPNFGDAARN
jgi:hypothetical protein